MSRHRLSLTLAAIILALIGEDSAAVEKAGFKLLQSLGEVCGAVLADANKGSNPPRQQIEPIAFTDAPGTIALPKGLTAVERKGFDFDNDGFEDRIFVQTYSDKYMWGDVFYVKKGGVASDTTSTAPVNIADVMIFPCQFDRRVKSALDCPPISQNADGAGILLRFAKGKDVFFPGRYTEMHPFRYVGRTYLSLVSFSQDTQFLRAVIEPTGGSSYRPVCLLQGQEK